MTNKLFQNKKAISPLIATVILIGISIAGGALVYSIVFSTTNTLNTTSQLNFQSINLIKDTADNTVFATTIKNIGNKPIDELTITLHQEQPQTITTINAQSPLQPGQSIAYTNQTLEHTYITGNNYNVILTAQTTDQSTLTQTTSVMCTIG